MRKSAEKVKFDFFRKGISIAEWARAYGFNERLTRAVLSGQVKGVRGDSHKIAVLLGIKDGEIVDIRTKR